MTTLTLRLIKGDFDVTGPDVEPVKFNDWCAQQHPGSPIEEIGPGGGKRVEKKQRAKPER